MNSLVCLFEKPLPEAVKYLSDNLNAISSQTTSRQRKPRPSAPLAAHIMGLTHYNCFLVSTIHDSKREAQPTHNCNIPLDFDRLCCLFIKLNDCVCEFFACSDAKWYRLKAIATRSYTTQLIVQYVTAAKPRMPIPSCVRQPSLSLFTPTPVEGEHRREAHALQAVS